MRKERLKTAAIIILLVISIGLGGITIHQSFFASPAKQDKTQNFGYFESVAGMINSKYSGQVESNTLVQGALKGMFDKLDDYSMFYDKDGLKSFLERSDGTFDGIGVLIEKIGNDFIITKVYEDSPAEKAGIRTGDIIEKIDNFHVSGEPLEKLTEKIKGPSDTKVSMQILRDGKNEPVQIEVIRGTVRVNPIEYRLLKDIAYIKISHFDSNTAEYFSKAMEDIDKNNISKIVLDIRNNAGGEISQAVEIAKKFVPKGLITKIDFKDASFDDIVYSSDLEKPRYRVAVLVNEKSASASEVLAGAIQDRDAGKLVGTKTFGKAKVQKLIPILTPEAFSKYTTLFNKAIVDGYELANVNKMNYSESDVIGSAKITVGNYLTPNGKTIQGKGIEPDFIVENAASGENVQAENLEMFLMTDIVSLFTLNPDVLNLERKLAILGYNVDIPDGRLDNTTKKEIKKFQADNKLKITGEMDTETQMQLNDKLDEMVTSIDKQYAKALEILRN